jgi:hypothetical protein
MRLLSRAYLTVAATAASEGAHDNKSGARDRTNRHAGGPGSLPIAIGCVGSRIHSLQEPA